MLRGLIVCINKQNFMNFWATALSAMELSPSASTDKTCNQIFSSLFWLFFSGRNTFLCFCGDFTRFQFAAEPFLFPAWRCSCMTTSSSHLIITSLLDKDTRKSPELFDRVPIELFIKALLRDISQILMSTYFMCQTTLTLKELFSIFVRGEENKRLQGW